MPIAPLDDEVVVVEEDGVPHIVTQLGSLLLTPVVVVVVVEVVLRLVLGTNNHGSDLQSILH